MGLCSCPVGCLAWGFPALHHTACWVGLGPGGEMVQEGSHQSCCCQCLCSCSEPQLPPTSAGGSPILAGRSGPVSYEVTAFFPGSWCTLECLPSKSGASVSPSPVEFLQSNPAGLQSQILCGLLLPLPDPQAGKSDVGLRTFTSVGQLLWYNHFPIYGSCTQQVWDLILSWLCPSYRFVMASSLSLGVGYLF